MPHAIYKKTFQGHFIGSAVSFVPVVLAGSVVHIVPARCNQWRSSYIHLSMWPEKLDVVRQYIWLDSLRRIMMALLYAKHSRLLSEIL
jgi:hypothetical protein